MKYFFTIFFSIILFRVNGQNFDKATIQKCYSEGIAIIEKLKILDSTGLTSYIDTTTLNKLFRLVRENEDNLRMDLYYDYRIQNFVFTIYSGRSIKNNTEWGLFKYYFITTINFELKKLEITKVKTITNNAQDKKVWWQNFMISYGIKEYLRKDWADNFGLIPPPPPPPESSSWL